MNDIRPDILERIEAVVRQRTQLEARERRLRALLRDEEAAQQHQSPSTYCPGAAEVASGNRLREFVLGSLKDGKAWSLDDLKEHAHGVGLTTAGASGRILNITLVNLLREGLVARLQNGRWRLRDQAIQLPLDLAS
jgi:hypothetical protein